MRRGAANWGIPSASAARWKTFNTITRRLGRPTIKPSEHSISHPSRDLPSRSLLNTITSSWSCRSCFLSFSMWRYSAGWVIALRDDIRGVVQKWGMPTTKSRLRLLHDALCVALHGDYLECLRGNRTEKPPLDSYYGIFKCSSLHVSLLRRFYSLPV